MVGVKTPLTGFLRVKITGTIKQPKDNTTVLACWRFMNVSHGDVLNIRHLDAIIQLAHVRTQREVGIPGSTAVYWCGLFGSRQCCLKGLGLCWVNLPSNFASWMVNGMNIDVIITRKQNLLVVGL